MKEEHIAGGYRLRHAPGVFPLGQDSMLLAAFARVRPRGRGVDLGAGAGVLSLLLLSQHPDVRLVALERDAAALSVLAENCAINKLAARMEICAGDVRDVRTLIPHGALDFAVCNPPYFVQGAGAAHTSLSAARQQECGVEAFVNAAAFALKQGGRAAFVYRPERLISLLAAFSAAKLAPKRLRFVHQRMGSAPSAVLVEGMKGAREGLCVLPPFLVEAPDGEYSAEYKRIYHMQA